MNSKTSLQQLKSFLLVPSLFLLPLIAPNVADAAVKIKDTSYRIPNNAYFVSPNGKKNNSGKSPGSPLTVEKAIAVAPRGATIVFRGGTYRGVDTRITKRLTLQAYPHEKPLLKGSVVVEGWVADGSTWRKDGWTYSFAPNKGKEFIDRKYPMAGHRDMVYVAGVSLRQVGSKAEVKPGTFYVDSHNKLYIGSNPAGKTVEATARVEAFEIMTTRSSKPAGTKIRGLGFAHYADDGIGVMSTPHLTIENNTFVWNGLYGVSFQLHSTDAVLRGNTFSFNGMNGVRGGWADRMLLEGNTFSHNNIEHFRKDWSGAGIKVINTSGVVWRNNLFEHNVGNGMWLDESSTNATIKDNVIRDNEQIGIMFELSHKANISGNTISNNPAGIMIADSSNAHIVGNRFSNNKKHVVVKDSPRKNKDRAEIAKGADWVTRNNVVKNNQMSR